MIKYFYRTILLKTNRVYTYKYAGCIYNKNDKLWSRNKILHRADGPAIEYANGDKEWYENGKRHRENGPAVETSERNEWWVDGRLHREDGPAHETISGPGKGHKVWWYRGRPRL